LGSPAGDEGAHGTAVATDPRPLIDRVSESGDIEPGRAGYRCTLRTGDHLPLARLVIVADICADGEANLNATRNRASSAKNIPWRGNLVAFISNAKSFQQNISPLMVDVANMSRPWNSAATRQNHPFMTVQVKFDIDRTVKLFPDEGDN
jgi:hypothetical protein